MINKKVDQGSYIIFLYSIQFENASLSYKIIILNII